MNYPSVIGEFLTLEAVLGGKSIARLGDGEFKLIDGFGYAREPGSAALAAELRAVLRRPDSNCIVGIPTMDPAGPKYENWIRHQDRFARIIDYPRAPHDYFSAFITRPDSAPWINTVEFALLFERVWTGKRTVVVSEPKNSILAAAGPAARKLKHIACPSHQAYSKINDLEREVYRAKPEIALLSCGPTATCLANRLAARGIQAVDIGSAGGFLLRLLIGAAPSKSVALYTGKANIGREI